MSKPIYGVTVGTPLNPEIVIDEAFEKSKNYVDNAIDNIPPTDLSDYYKKSDVDNKLPNMNNYYSKEEIDTTKVGQKTSEGGEIFNDYENNQAITPYSSTRGKNNISGGRCFTITSLKKIEGSVGEVRCEMVLDSVEGLAVNDIICATIGNNYTNFAKIVKIDSKTIHLDTYPVDCTPSKVSSGNAIIWVGDKPLIGTKPLEFGQSTDGINNIAVHEGSRAVGEDNISIGKYAHTSGKKNIAGYAAEAHGRENQALGHYSTAGGNKNKAVGLYSDANGVNTLAVGWDSFTRGEATTAGTNAFKVQGINFEPIPEEPEVIKGQIAEVWVGEGYNYQFPSISTAIDQCGLTSENDVLIINLMTDIGWPSDPVNKYPFKVIVRSGDESQKKVSLNTQNATFGGRMEFQNVHITGNNKTIRFGTYDITMDSKSCLDVFYVTCGAANTGRTVNGQTIKLLGDVAPININIPNGYHKNIYDGNVNLIFGNYKKGKIGLTTNNDDKNVTVYKKNLNFDFRNALSIPEFNPIINNPKVEFEGSIHIINSSPMPIHPDLPNLVDVANNRKWVLTNISACKDVLGFDDTGKFTVRDGYIATAYNAFDEPIVSSNGILDLSASAGEYTVDIIESSALTGTFTLDSVVGIEVNDIVSIKDTANQSFILNLGTVVEVDKSTSTLTVTGYPSKINNFNARSSCLFVLSKPMIGTTVLGKGSSATGKGTKAIGENSTSNGKGTIATGDHQHVFGAYNSNKPDTIIELGAGTSDTNRTNAFEVYKDGSVRLYDIKISRDRWRKLLEKSLEEVKIDLSNYYTKEEVEERVSSVEVDLTDYVKNTDYATTSKGGTVRTTGWSGVCMVTPEVIGLSEPSKNDIDNRSEYKGILCKNLDYAVKSGLTANTETLTEEEKANACEWVGAVEKVEYSKNRTIAEGSDGGTIGRAYIVDRKGAQNSIVLDCQITNYTVPVRDASGNFYVGNPSIPQHCATKGYVDKAVGDMETVLDNLITIQESIIAEQESIIAMQNSLIGGVE